MFHVLDNKRYEYIKIVCLYWLYVPKSLHFFNTEKNEFRVEVWRRKNTLGGFRERGNLQYQYRNYSIRMTFNKTCLFIRL